MHPAFRYYGSLEGRQNGRDGKGVQEEGGGSMPFKCVRITQGSLLHVGLFTGVLESWVRLGGCMAGVRHWAVDTAVACGLSTDQKL